MNILEIDSVHLSFKERVVLQNIYLCLKTNKIVGLFGRNGCGKSSLMKIIFGTLKSQNVSIRINRSYQKNLYYKRNLISYLAQSNFIPNSFTVKQVFNDYNISLQEFKLYFPSFVIEENKKIALFSSGEKRIIELFLTLKSDVKFCLLDEPFSQIMPLHIEAIKTLIIEEKANKAILISDHLYKNVLDVCDDLYLIKDTVIYLLKNEKELEKYEYISILD